MCSCGMGKEELAKAAQTAVIPLVDELVSLVHEMNDSLGTIVSDFGSAIRELKRNTERNTDKFDHVQRNMEKWENDLNGIKRKLERNSNDHNEPPRLKRIRAILQNETRNNPVSSDMTDAEVQTVRQIFLSGYSFF